MATKRSAPASFDNASSRPYNKRHRVNTAQPHKPLPSNLGKKSFKKAHSVNDLKSSIRSLKRLLTGPNSSKLPATIRAEKERALQTAEQDLKREQDAIKKDACISRWHKVRFFDRQKGERRLKKARKALKTAVEEDAESEVLTGLREKIEELENEVNYAMYYPLDKDYVPLFPTKRSKDGEDEKESSPAAGEVERQGDAEMWELVRKCAKEGRLKDLREGRLRMADSGDEGEREEGQKPTAKKAKTKGKTETKQASRSEQEEHEEKDEQAESDNESGGGFFE